jgi:hypothetical protein
MNIPVFTQVDSTLAYALSTLAETELDGYWAGYFAGSSSNLGASASTTTVWQDTGGFYLFLDKTPADWTVFANDLSALRSDFDPQNNARCVWIGNADQLSLHWNITALNASFSGSGSSIVWTQVRACAFVFGAYIYSLKGLSILSYIADSNGGGIGFSGGGGFSGPAGGYDFPSAQISFSGPALGAFNGTMPVPAPADPEQTDLWTALNIGLQYAAAPVPIPVSTAANLKDSVYQADLSDAGATRILFMPVFARQTTALSLGILFDPFNLLAAARTVLSLFPSGESPSPPALDSYMRTTRGYEIQLRPLAASGQIPPAQFVFGSCPVAGSDSAEGSSYHLCPDGAFQINIQNPKSLSEEAVVSNLVLMGLSGLEYVNLEGADYMVVFQGSQPAFIPAVDPSGNIAPDISQALTNIATTSYLNVLAYSEENQNPVYYAQPREAPVFSGQVPRKDGILNFNPIPAAALSYTAQQLPPVFPVGIYAGLTSEQAGLAREMENSSLAPYRNYCIGNAYGAGAASPEARAAAAVPRRRVRSVNDPLGVTPQGLVAELTPDYNDFDGLIIGNMPNTDYPKIDLTAVAGKFKQTLLSNQLFFVASNVDVLMSGTSVRYQLTEADKPYLLALKVPQNVIDAVYRAAAASPQPFPTEGEFVNCIKSAAAGYLACFLYIGGILKVEMDGWAFQLSPRTWRTDAENPTMMIAKFCDRSLIDLANDSSSWNWSEAATLPGSWSSPAVSDPSNGWTYPGTTNPQPVSVAQTQTILLKILNAAGAADAPASLRIFYDTVANDPNWNGFLFLNAPVAIGEFPDDLKFLTAGIDLTKFYAHHIGFSQTPFTVQNGNPQLEQTAAFGLIDYEDKADLYSEETIPFGFKTMRLRARFANASLVDFSSEVELMLNQLLGSVLSKSEAARGNNLIIEGSYQRVGGAPSYAFTLTGQNLFNANDSALTSIEVLSVQLVNGGNPGSENVLTTFILTGNLRFVRYEDFDLFSFGPGENNIDAFLRYSGLSIDMSFSMRTPAVQTFVVRESNTAFDMSNSVARPSSLLNNFPLTVTALVSSPNLSTEGEKPTGQTPEDMGYTSISAPIEQTPMIPSWYGLVFTLDLGTFGALTGNVSFKIGILAAWSEGPSQESLPVYLGLKLPGISAIAGSFPLQGVLKLGFRSFQFETYEDNDQLAYLLRLRRFALSVLVWSFPPGNADIVLFGQPRNPKGSLGWYAAYDGTKPKTSSSTKLLAADNTKAIESGESEKAFDPVQRRLRSGRRKQRIG